MNTISTSTLRPGLLVSLKTSVAGNVTYTRRDIERNARTKDGKLRAKWETERTITDPAEFDEAQTVRSKVNSLIRGVCAKSAFGLLCPESASEDLDAAVAAARGIADDFNTRASLTRIHVYVIAGRIAADDVEAVRVINSEIRDLMTEMADGMKNLDVKVVRDAANRVRSVGKMLSPLAEARVKLAIDTARKVANEINKAGEQAAIEIDRVVIRKVKEMRTSFLDLDDAAPVATPKGRGNAVDLEPESNKPARRAARGRARVEMED